MNTSTIVSENQNSNSVNSATRLSYDGTIKFLDEAIACLYVSREVMHALAPSYMAAKGSEREALSDEFMAAFAEYERDFNVIVHASRDGQLDSVALAYMIRLEQSRTEKSFSKVLLAAEKCFQ